MDNIIKFEPNKAKRAILNSEAPKTRASFLELCKETLDQDDYMELLCAILDKEIFDKIDSDMQDLVEIYYELV